MGCGEIWKDSKGIWQDLKGIREGLKRDLEGTGEVPRESSGRDPGGGFLVPLVHPRGLGMCLGSCPGRALEGILGEAFGRAGLAGLAWISAFLAWLADPIWECFWSTNLRLCLGIWTFTGDPPDHPPGGGAMPGFGWWPLYKLIGYRGTLWMVKS